MSSPKDMMSLKECQKDLQGEGGGVEEEEEKHSTAHAGKVTRAKEHWQLFCFKKKKKKKMLADHPSSRSRPKDFHSQQTTNKLQNVLERRKRRRQGGKRVETSFLYVRTSHKYYPLKRYLNKLETRPLRKHYKEKWKKKKQIKIWGAGAKDPPSSKSIWSIDCAAQCCS